MGDTQYGVIFSLVLVSIVLPIVLQLVAAPVTGPDGRPIPPPYCAFNDPKIGFNLNDPACTQSQPQNSIVACQQINFQSTSCNNVQLTVANGQATCGSGAISGALAGEAAGVLSGNAIGYVIGAFGGFLTGAGVGCGVLPAASPALTNSIGNSINSVPVLGDFAKAINYLVNIATDFMAFSVSTIAFEGAMITQSPFVGGFIGIIWALTIIMFAYTGLRLIRGGG